MMIMCLLLKEANTLEHRGDGFVLIWNRAERDGAAVCVCVCPCVSAWVKLEEKQHICRGKTKTF